MPRVARIVVPGVPHHITQRGNNLQDVFFVEDDRRAYLSILKNQAARYRLSILGYCLMTNHIHLVATPSNHESLHKAVGRTHWLYAQYVNRLHGRSGHLWQNRFYSCPLDQADPFAVLAYVERNPVRAKILRHPWLYRWSSAAAHLNKKEEIEITDLEWWGKYSSRLDWRAILSRADDKAIVADIRLHTCRGRPLGSDAFMSKIESTLGRRLRPLPVGRPKKPGEK
jgi:putative transposase